MQLVWIWQGAFRKQKKFCEACGSNGREYNWSHRPLQERFYGKRTDVCDSCITRRENYVQRGGNVKIDALDSTVETTTMHHSPGNLWDVLSFFVDNIGITIHRYIYLSKSGHPCWKSTPSNVRIKSGILHDTTRCDAVLGSSCVGYGVRISWQRRIFQDWTLCNTVVLWF